MRGTAIAELSVQSELVKAARAEGGFAFKASHKLLIGVLDLFVKLPGYPGLWLEVKFHRGITKSGVLPLPLTPHQRRFITDLQAAGGQAGWLMVAELGRASGHFLLAAGADPKATHVQMNGQLERRRGQPWPILQVVKQLTPSLRY